VTGSVSALQLVATKKPKAGETRPATRLRFKSVRNFMEMPLAGNGNVALLLDYRIIIRFFAH
jgi:hypothetical protein